MSEFVEECRREWRRLGVPDPVANEMAPDLAAGVTHHPQELALLCVAGWADAVCADKEDVATTAAESNTATSTRAFKSLTRFL